MGPCEHRYIYTGAHARAEKFAENLEDDAGGAYNTNIPSKAGLYVLSRPRILYGNEVWNYN